MLSPDRFGDHRGQRDSNETPNATGLLRCCACWTVLTSPPGRHWRGCCGPGMLGRTLSRITTLCWTCDRGAARRRPPRLDPDTGARVGQRLLARSDSAGARHAFAAGCVERGVRFSFGFPVDVRIQRIVDVIPDECWHPAIQTDGDLREGAWVAEATGMIDLSSWPQGSRLTAQGAAPPRRPAESHRCRRPPDHWDPHQHPDRDRAGSGCRARTATSSTCTCRGPHPRGQGHWPP